MIVGAGDEARPAFPRIHHPDREVIAGEVDRRGEPGGAAADDQAIVAGLFAHGRHQRRGLRQVPVWHGGGTRASLGPDQPEPTLMRTTILAALLLGAAQPAGAQPPAPPAPAA